MKKSKLKKRIQALERETALARIDIQQIFQRLRGIDPSTPESLKPLLCNCIHSIDNDKPHEPECDAR